MTRAETRSHVLDLIRGRADTLSLHADLSLVAELRATDPEVIATIEWARMEDRRGD